MSRNRIESADFREVASSLGVSDEEVRVCVKSFFDAIALYSKSLPFDDRRKIYKADIFREYAKIWNIPSLGRIGPHYGRYLLWRKNESGNFLQEHRDLYRLRVPQSEIETMAADILEGKVPAPLKKKKGKELYERVWLVGKEGKRQARQVIPKNKKDV